jgi:hypothetical protein
VRYCLENVPYCIQHSCSKTRSTSVLRAKMFRCARKNCLCIARENVSLRPKKLSLYCARRCSAAPIVLPAKVFRWARKCTAPETLYYCARNFVLLHPKLCITRRKSWRKLFALVCFKNKRSALQHCCAKNSVAKPLTHSIVVIVENQQTKAWLYMYLSYQPPLYLVHITSHKILFLHKNCLFAQNSESRATQR